MNVKPKRTLSGKRKKLKFASVNSRSDHTEPSSSVSMMALRSKTTELSETGAASRMLHVIPFYVAKGRSLSSVRGSILRQLSTCPFSIGPVALTPGRWAFSFGIPISASGKIGSTLLRVASRRCRLDCPCRPAAYSCGLKNGPVSDPNKRTCLNDLSNTPILAQTDEVPRP